MLLAVAVFQRPAKSEDHYVVGYLMFRGDVAQLEQSNALDKLTHLNLAFANPREDGTFRLPANLNEYVEAAHKANVKVLISIGGGSASENKSMRQRYFDFIADDQRDSFVERLVNLVKSNHLDGLDVDLEGPAIGEDYGKFIAALASRFHGENLLLTAALSKGYGGSSVPDESLQQFDFINVMAYDATGSWAPNNPGPHSSFEFAKSNTEYWLKRGLPKEKLVLGVPFYGRGFNKDTGHHTYRTIVRDFPNAHDVDQVGDVVYYNGTKTIEAKSQYVKDNGLKGIMIWEISQDTNDEHSLLGIINRTLN
ncbi:glycosyl hydrolase family 18 protein [Rhodopirellula sp. MGV]|uniref:glycosyl hydrolase family 18 protein n=1 Tax=Rhodopirellula sp. MGV TaxID=2023130 RepID=UPI000B962F24|nr:glycosyl hydrolase family 18 protein [Rhodopirellula sp. MGV]OYP38857.1 hypothetical protein CGZ80_01155 [Rhodopirellula sp. MGV]PNY37666.1 glycoside hydrolase [Rhodopirellula baltica]